MLNNRNVLRELVANSDSHKTTASLLGVLAAGSLKAAPATEPEKTSAPLQVPQESVKDHVKNLEVLGQEIASANTIGEHFFEFSYQGVAVTILLEVDQNNDRRLSTVQSNGQSLAKIPGLRNLLESFKIPLKDVSLDIATANIKSGAMFAQAPRPIAGQDERKNILLQRTAAFPSIQPR